MKSHMRYASVCDGIGAAHVAWQPLGWECAWTSEIEPFPAAVVDHHWNLKNLGDMTKLTEEMLNECGPISLLCGGTPCQSFSVAGLRKGLEDPRGNLALRFTQLVGVLRPEWVVWENVPGVLSSGEGRDFGAFLGALAELGYGFAYRILDAQWFGVAQRRRRVFVVANARDWRRAAAVLFERESLFGNPPTRRAKGQDTAGTTGDGIARCLTTGESQRQDWETCNFVAGTLNANGKAAGSATQQDAEQGMLVAFQGGSQQDQVLSGDAVCPALCHSSNGHKGHHQPKVFVSFTKSKRAQTTSDDETWVLGEVSPTMSCFDQGDTRATTVVAFDILGTQATNAAKTTDVHVPLRARQPGQSEASTTTVVAQGFTYSGYSNQPAWITGDRTDCLPASGHSDGSHQGVGVVAFKESQSGCRVGDVHATLDANKGSRRVEGVICGDGHTVGTLRSNTRNNSDPATEAAMHVMHGMAVRRLTPKECERLQGFPDGYTDVIYRKKPAADGPRYRALGNSMAVPVMAWIGQRIAEVEATDGTDTQH